jgi:hypothetical protein
VYTTPKVLLRLIRQRWSIEKKWHWAGDAQLGGDAPPDANRTNDPAVSLFKNSVMNPLCCGGNRSNR